MMRQQEITPTDDLASHDLSLGSGNTLRVVMEGQGAPVGLVHGALVDGRDWLLASSLLRPHGRLLVVDRPGHGASRRPRFDADPHSQAARIRAGLAKLNAERPLLVGHSLGAAVCLAYAADFPDEVAGLVLVAPVAFPEIRPMEHGYLAPRSAPFAGPMLSAFGRATSDPAFWVTVRKLMFSPQEPPPGWLSTYPASEVTRPERLVVEGEDAAAMFPGAPGSIIDYDRITAPAIILTGGRDKVADPNRHARPLARLLSQAELREFPDIGHMLHHTAPGEVAAAVAELLARTPR